MLNFADLVFHDQPFGLGRASWDEKALTSEELSKVYRQLNALSADQNYIYCSYVSLEHISKNLELLGKGEFGFQRLSAMVVYKSTQNVALYNNLVFACDFMLLALQGKANLDGFSKNPLLRHNNIMGPGLDKLYVHKQLPVNEHEKHPG